MKLDSKEFKRFKELSQKVKGGKATAEEKKELDALSKKKASNKPGSDTGTFTPGNDFSWWNKIPELIRDSASFKCNWVPGTEIAPSVIVEKGYGVLRVVLDTCLGCTVAPTDAVNIWARDLYLRMFQKYRPASGYSASDLGITLIGAYEAVKLIASYERIYGIINRYSKLNANMPTVEASALGLTSSELTYLQGHLSDFRYDLNFLIRKAQRLCIPKDMSIIADAISLFGYEYMDHESVRSQMILFTQAEYGLYSDTSIKGGSIEYKEVTSLFNFSADNMCVLLDDVLNALLGSDSVQRIFADLVVWFGESAMLQYVPVPEDYTVYPVKSESILHKLHNLEMTNSSVYRIGSWLDNALTTTDKSYVMGKHMVYQVDDRIVTAVNLVNIPSGATSGTFSYNVHGYAGEAFGTSALAPLTMGRLHVVDTAHNDIQPEIIVEGVMFKTNSVSISGGGFSGVAVLDASFYLVRNITLYYNGGSVGNTQNIATTAANAAANAGYFACVDWAPLFYVHTGSVITHIFGEYDNIVYVSGPDYARIARTIVLSGLETNAQVVNK